LSFHTSHEPKIDPLSGDRERTRQGGFPEPLSPAHLSGATGGGRMNKPDSEISNEITKQVESFLEQLIQNQSSNQRIQTKDEISLWNDKRDFALGLLNRFHCYFSSVESTEDGKKFKERVRAYDIPNIQLFEGNYEIEIGGQYIREPIEDLKWFLSSDYLPPEPQDDPVLNTGRLLSLITYYQCCVESRLYEKLPFSIIQTFDLVLARYAEWIGVAMFVVSSMGRERDRIFSSTKKVSASKAQRKQRIIELYHSLTRSSALTKSAIANEIRKRLRTQGVERLPHRDTIISYLREDGLLD